MYYKNFIVKGVFFMGQKFIKGVNDLQTLYPDVASEWCYELNGTLIPENVMAHSGKRVFWRCKLGHVWDTTIHHRTSHNSGCPYCANRKVLVGYNDLATTHPHVAKQWDYELNGDLKPTDITYGYNHKIHFVCSNGHKWKGTIVDRASECGCPYCTNKLPTKENNLLVCNPEIAKEWDSQANIGLTNQAGRDVSTPDKVTPKSHVRANWICDKGHRWSAIVKSRTQMRSGCPCCNVSKGEEAVRNILIKLQIPFRAENTFPDRKFDKSNALRDDFAILDNENQVIGTIEYNGEQHYRPLDFSGHNPERAKAEFKKIQDRDETKTKYLQDHNIPHLIIPYFEYNNIEKIVTDFLKSLSL